MRSISLLVIGGSPTCSVSDMFGKASICVWVPVPTCTCSRYGFCGLRLRRLARAFLKTGFRVQVLRFRVEVLLIYRKHTGLLAESTPPPPKFAPKYSPFSYTNLQTLNPKP